MTGHSLIRIRELSTIQIGEVYVLGQQHASFKKAGRGEIRIGRAAHALVEDCDGVMAGLRKQTL